MNRIWLCCVALFLIVFPGRPSQGALYGEENRGKNDFPRVGDSLEELTARYGPGKKNAGKIRIPGNDEYYWEMKGLGINVVMQEESAVMLVAHGLGQKITAAEIKALLAANAHGTGWRPDGREPRWLRNDRKLEAFREKDHDDMFFVQDIAVVAKSGHGAIPGGR